MRVSGDGVECERGGWSERGRGRWERGAGERSGWMGTVLRVSEGGDVK